MKSKFSLKVHHKDPKTGQLKKVDPYQMKFSANGGTRFYRRGIEFYENGEPVNEEKYLKEFGKEIEAANSDPALVQERKMKALSVDLENKMDLIDSKLSDLDEMKKDLEQREYDLVQKEKAEQGFTEEEVSKALEDSDLGSVPDHDPDTGEVLTPADFVPQVDTPALKEGLNV